MRNFRRRSKDIPKVARRPINQSEEAKAARAILMSYESFMLALWIWNYMGDTTLTEKRKIVETLRTQPVSVWNYVQHAKPMFPNPLDPKWRECIKATGFPALGEEPSSEEELSDVIKMKLNLKES